MSRILTASLFLSSFVLCRSAVCAQVVAPVPPPAGTKSNYRVEEIMIPMRDGVRLQTVVIRSLRQSAQLPILLPRTPYGVPTQEEFDKVAAKEGADWLPPN